jgi:predicted phage-related endonuclease
MDEQAGHTGIHPAVRVCPAEQNTEQWGLDRLGMATASEFHKAIQRGRADRPSVTRRKYLLELLGERLTGEPAPGFSNANTDRGHAMEPDAAADYEIVSGNAVETIGFMHRDGMGVSLDRIVTGQPGFIEIKSMKPDILLATILSDEMPAEHKAQVQGGLMVAGLEWADFVAYWPNLPLFVKRIARDEDYIDWLRGQIHQFNQELDALERHMRERYYSVAAV